MSAVGKLYNGEKKVCKFCGKKRVIRCTVTNKKYKLADCCRKCLDSPEAKSI